MSEESDDGEVSDPPHAHHERPSRAGFIAGAAVSCALFFLGLFMKVEQDIATITEREHAHNEEDEREFKALQSEVDHRFDSQAQLNRDRLAQAQADKDSIADIRAQLAADKVEVETLWTNILILRQQYEQGRGERMGSDDNLARRLDDLGSKVLEIQRENAVLEGRLASIVPWNGVPPSRGRGK